MRPKNLCVCRNVNKEDIDKAVRDGCDTYGKLIKHTNATTGCGTCLPEIKEAFEESLLKFKKENDPQKSLSFER